MKYLRLHKVIESNVQEVEFDLVKFSGGERHVKLKGDVPYCVTIETRLHTSDDIMTLLIATDALRRAGALDIYLLAPYMPYARQDRVMVPGEALSAKVMADLINAQDYVKVITLDLHSPVMAALLNNCVQLDPARWLDLLINRGDVIVSPDAGAYKKCFSIAKAYGNTLVSSSKVRDVSTGDIVSTKLDTSDLHGADCLIIDDICDGGRTFIEIAKELKTKNCGKISLFVSHCILSNGLKIFKHIDQIYTLNFFKDIESLKDWNIQELLIREEDLCLL